MSIRYHIEVIFFLIGRSFNFSYGVIFRYFLLKKRLILICMFSPISSTLSAFFLSLFPNPTPSPNPCKS